MGDSATAAAAAASDAVSDAPAPTAPPADAAAPPAAAATAAPPAPPAPATAASSSSHHAFLAKLQQPAAASLSRALKSFVRHASADKARSVAQLAELTQTFFRDTEEAIAGHALWRDEPPEALERACDAVEKVVMSRLHDRVFLADAAERAADAALGERLGFLQFVDADHLGIPPAVTQPIADATGEITGNIGSVLSGEKGILEAPRGFVDLRKRIVRNTADHCPAIRWCMP